MRFIVKFVKMVKGMRCMNVEESFALICHDTTKLSNEHCLLSSFLSSFYLEFSLSIHFTCAAYVVFFRNVKKTKETRVFNKI